MSFEFVTKLPTPEEIRLQYPITEKIARVKAQRDQEIKDIFTGEVRPISGDHRPPAPQTMKIPYVIMWEDWRKSRIRWATVCF